MEPGARAARHRGDGTGRCHGRFRAPSGAAAPPADAGPVSSVPPTAGNPTLVLRNVDVALLVQALQQQRQAGQAIVAMIAEGGSAAAPPPVPREDGKGSLVDVVA